MPAPPDFRAASRASTSAAAASVSSSSNCASRDDAAISACPATRASSRRTFSSKRDTSVVGSRTLIEEIASWTCDCACADFARATSSSRLPRSCSSFSFICARPVLSFSTTSFWEVIIGSAARASFSKAICLDSATFARLSNRSASEALPELRSWSALADAAAALAPQSAAAATSAAWSCSARRTLPMVTATASSASAIELV